MSCKLEEIEDELRKGRVKGRLNELWALLGAVNASIERGWGSGLLLMMRGWGRLHGWVFRCSFFPFCLRSIDIVAFFRSFRSSRWG